MIIKTVAELRELIAEPNPVVSYKVQLSLTTQAKDFIARSPFLLLATVNRNGEPTVSPKGDGAGFVLVEDDSTLCLPERKGNRLLYGLQNILENPNVALIFLLPGTGETLRVSGVAELVNDAALNHKLTARNQPALLAVRIRIRECYFHCAKALLRSELWQSERWAESVKISFGQEIARNQGMAGSEVNEFDAQVAQRYKTDL